MSERMIQHFENLFTLLTAASHSYNAEESVNCACQLRSISVIASKAADEIHPIPQIAADFHNCPLETLSGRTIESHRRHAPTPPPK